MSEPTSDDLLPENAGTDAALTAARREHTERIAAALDLDAGLAVVLSTGKQADRTGPGAASPGLPTLIIVPAPALTGEQVQVILTMRSRARALARALDLARSDNLAVFLLARNRALADARALARTLADARTRTDARARALNDARARALADALVDALAFPAPALDPDRYLADARALARELARRVGAGGVNASGADLSNLELTDISMLDGVVWTEETTWPPGAHEHVRLRSAEIGPGLYQVRGGSERDRAGLATV